MPMFPVMHGVCGADAGVLWSQGERLRERRYYTALSSPFFESAEKPPYFLHGLGQPHTLYIDAVGKGSLQP